VRPVPLPDSLRAALAAEGAEFAVLAGPSGDLTDEVVAPVEVAFYEAEVASGGRVAATGVLLQLESGDLEALAATGQIWLGFWGRGCPVFFVSAVPPNESA
jgi:hypothetical protein